MKKYKIRLNTINDASLFTAKCNEYKDVDIDCLYGRYIIDAKSVMGVLSIGLEKDYVVILHSDNKRIQDIFYEDIRLWVVEE